METVLYADVFLLCDFCMDLISLCLAGKLCRLKIKKGRVVAASVFGALFSLAVTLLSPEKFLRFILTLVCSLFSVVIAFGKGKILRVIRRAIILWATVGLIGGVVSALSSFGVSHRGKLSFILVLSVSVSVVFLMVRLILRRPVAGVAFVKVSFGGKAASFSGLVDSGNLLRDPFSGTPVIIVSPEVAKKIFDTDGLRFLTDELLTDVPQSLIGRTRVIPTKTVRSDSLVRAVIPESVTVDGTPKKVFVAVSVPLSDLVGYDGIIPSSVSATD